MSSTNQDTMVTRCPKCSTAFRITTTQLESAKGAVRCGSCLHVFKAQSHLMTKAPTPVPVKLPHPTTAAMTTSSTTSTPAKATVIKTTLTDASPAPAVTSANSGKIKSDTAKNSGNTKLPPSKPVVEPSPQEKVAPTSKAKGKSSINHDDDLLISDDMDESGEGLRYQLNNFMDLETKIKANSLFDRKIKNEEEKVIIDNTDESWAESLIDDEDDVPSMQNTKAQKNSQQKIQDTTNKQVFNFSEASQADHKPKDSGDYATDTSDPFYDNPNQQNYSYQDDKEEIINAIPVAGIFHDEEFEDSANKRQLKIEPKIRASDSTRAGLLKNIMPAPLEFTANNISYWYRKLLWTVLVLVSILVLILQLAYFRFDYYARIQPYRNIYAFFGFDLPALVDKKRIVTYNLIVQAHTDVDNALLVDVMLLNKAEFAQPFPDLLLSFSNMDGVVKASRRFTPEDYLAGELAGKKIMPSQQPIHITLEITDPKLDNYKMDVL